MSKITTQLFGDLLLIPKAAQATAKETLAFMTDVMQAYTADEFRIQLRTVPRATLEYTTPLQPNESPEVFNTQYGSKAASWAVPMWAEAQYVGTVAPGATTLNCDTLIHDLRADSLALVVDNRGKWQVVEIHTITATSITLYTGATAGLGCFVIPVRRGHATKIVNTVDGYTSVAKMTYLLDDAQIFTPDVPAQFLGDDIILEPFLVDSSIDVTMSAGLQVADYDVGQVSYRAPWVNSQVGKPYAAMMTNAQEVRDFKNFFARCAGKYQRFWMPTFENNLRKHGSGAVTNIITVEDDGYLANVGNRKHIAIQTDDDVWHPFVINTAINAGGGTTQLNLASSLDYDMARITAISYLGLHRLDTDSAAISYIGNGVAQCTLNVLELAP